MKKSLPNNLLLVAASESDANLYYATRFMAPDPFIFARLRGRSYLLMNDLEVDRARKQAKVDCVLSLSDLSQEFKKRHDRRPRYSEIITHFLAKHRVKKIQVPDNFPLGLAEDLRGQKIGICCATSPLFPERMVKSPYELASIRTAIRHTEHAITKALAVIKESVIRRGRLYHEGGVLTSEKIKKILNLSLMENGCIGSHSIVACGEQCIDPHDEGSGPLYANQSIIFDVFPRDAHSRYFADISRTVVRGKASTKLKAMYQAVLDGQDIAFNSIRNGVDGAKIHARIQKLFEERGFHTGHLGGRMQGFFHGTGHGLGLDIHEEPRISLGQFILKTGHVVTVEPGLYYSGAGGVRLEDDVLVTKTGCVNLVRLPKRLEL